MKAAAAFTGHVDMTKDITKMAKQKNANGPNSEF